MRRAVLVLVCLTVAAAADGPPAYLDHFKLLEWRDAAGAVHPINGAADWEKRRADIISNMQVVMGPLPDDSKRVPLDVQVLAEEKLPKFVRRKITYLAESGDRVPAYLLIPANLNGRKVPAVLCPHQTTPRGKEEPAGVAGSPTKQTARELAERGYVTLAPDYPGFGEYKSYDPMAHGYASATMKGVWNHVRAIDLLQSLPEVDGDRVGCIGHSLGGHNTLFIAAFDPRIKAAVTSCGFTSFPKYKNGDLTGWSSNHYMPRIAKLYHKDPRQVPFDFPEVLAAIAPRPVLAICPVHDDNFEVSGTDDCVAAAKPVYELLGAKDALQILHPDCKHEFPDDMRQAAYAWLDRWLKQ